jgi:HK97 family phage major capsid protein
LWQDAEAIANWLVSEMNEGLLDSLENIIIQGDGVGENLTGLLGTPGTTRVGWAGGLVETLRSAVTLSQIAGDVCNAWAVNPVDAQLFDTERADLAGLYLNASGYESGIGTGDASNILGAISTRVVSNSVPAGTAILGDWSQLMLWVRESARLDIDTAGELFTRNQFILRSEIRAVSGAVRPRSFYVVDLAPAPRGNLPGILGEMVLGKPNPDEPKTK